MVRYDDEHKARSRRALIEGAAALFRRYGYQGVGIDALCGSAGLTRGAFYGHFKSKAELFAEVLSGAHDLLRRLRERTGRSERAVRQQGVRIASDYLDPRNRDAVVRGCSLASLAMDTARANAASQKAYADAVEQVVEEFMRGREPAEQDAARAALALCVGGLLISGACGDTRTGVAVARAARREVKRLLDGS